MDLIPLIGSKSEVIIFVVVLLASESVTLIIKQLHTIVHLFTHNDAKKYVLTSTADHYRLEHQLPQLVNVLNSLGNILVNSRF